MSLLSRLGWLAILVVAGPSLAEEGADRPAEPQSPPPIKIVAPFNLSGPAGELGRPAANGAQLAVNQVNQKGGIDGRPLELVLVDSESKPDTVTAKVRAALDRNPDAIAGIGYTYSEGALDAGRVFQSKGLPFISPGATDPSVPAEVGDDMFYAAYSDDAQARAMARFLREELKLERVAVWINHSRLYPRTVGRYFTDSFTALGGKVTLIRSETKTSEYGAFLAELIAQSPQAEAIYAASLPATAPMIIEETRAAGVAVPLASADGWDETTITQASKEKSLDGIFYTTHMFLGVDTPAMKAFEALYDSAYGEKPPNAFAPLGFDSVNLLVNAIDRAGSIEPKAIRDALAATTDFEGIVGKISYTADDRVPKKAIAVIAVDDGVRSLRWVVEPD